MSKPQIAQLNHADGVIFLPASSKLKSLNSFMVMGLFIQLTICFPFVLGMQIKAVYL